MSLPRVGFSKHVVFRRYDASAVVKHLCFCETTARFLQTQCCLVNQCIGQSKHIRFFYFQLIGSSKQVMFVPKQQSEGRDTTCLGENSNRMLLKQVENENATNATSPLYRILIYKIYLLISINIIRENTSKTAPDVGRTTQSSFTVKFDINVCDVLLIQYLCEGRKGQP